MNQGAVKGVASTEYGKGWGREDCGEDGGNVSE